MTQLVITRGLPGSGKSTWASQWLTWGLKRARVNRDDIRIQQLGMLPEQGVLDYKGEQLVTEIQQTTVRKYLRFGYDVVVDDTNLRAAHSRAWADLAAEEGAEFEAVDFFDVSAEECHSRIARRAMEGGRHVPWDVIEGMRAKFLANGPLPPVVRSAKAEIELRQYVPDLRMPKAWIFDIDGTLAKMSNRSPFDWHRVDEDTHHEWVVDVLQALYNTGDLIFVVSGRDASCREMTEAWLERHDIPYLELFMRPAGDNRKDTIVKAELFWNHLAENFNIRGVFDDRNCVVEMWRAMGIPVAQTAIGDF